MDHCVLGTAEARGIGRDRIEDWFHVGRGSRNGSQDLGEGRLSIERLPCLVEETSVVHRDDRLVGESLDEVDLVGGERPNLLVAQHDHPDRLAPTKHRHGEVRAEPRPHGDLVVRIVGVGEGIGDVRAGAGECRPADDRLTAWRDRMLLPVPPVFLGARVRHDPIQAVAEQEERAHIGATEPFRARDDCPEHRLEIECRLADDPQHITGRGLTIERVFRLVEEADVLDSDDRLIGKGLDELDLAVGERAHLVPSERDHAKKDALPCHRDSKHGAESTDFLIVVQPRWNGRV